mmetsp:Transcript_54857/g.63322  ORF Transcript_54857/g.63322 Transcript_54857/m.63322 type:complete len:447 (+) Transcript_54857:116-1456(+)
MPEIYYNPKKKRRGIVGGGRNTNDEYWPGVNQMEEENGTTHVSVVVATRKASNSRLSWLYQHGGNDTTTTRTANIINVVRSTPTPTPTPITLLPPPLAGMGNTKNITTPTTSNIITVTAVATGITLSVSPVKPGEGRTKKRRRRRRTSSKSGTSSSTPIHKRSPISPPLPQLVTVTPTINTRAVLAPTSAAAAAAAAVSVDPAKAKVIETIKAVEAKCVSQKLNQKNHGKIIPLWKRNLTSYNNEGVYWGKNHRLQIVPSPSEEGKSGGNDGLPRNTITEEVESKDEDEDDSYDLRQIISLERLLTKAPLCSGGDMVQCSLPACSVWVSIQNPKKKWYYCIDCQERDFGGWPPAAEMPCSRLEPEHLSVITQKCSQKRNRAVPILTRCITPQPPKEVVSQVVCRKKKVPPVKGTEKANRSLKQILTFNNEGRYWGNVSIDRFSVLI